MSLSTPHHPEANLSAQRFAIGLCIRRLGVASSLAAALGGALVSGGTLLSAADPPLPPTVLTLDGNAAQTADPVSVRDALYLQSETLAENTPLMITQVMHSPDGVLRPVDPAGRGFRSRRMSDFVIETLNDDRNPVVASEKFKAEILVLQDDELPLPAPEPTAQQDSLELDATLRDESVSGDRILVPAPLSPEPKEEWVPPATVIEEIEVRESKTIESHDSASMNMTGNSSSSTWLDIRPRTVDGDLAELVPVDELPQDQSGLAPPTDVVQLIQYHQSDLLMADIWAGASFCHQPLYFEDQILERCGTITGALHHCPTVHSAAHFVLMTGTLPAHMALECPWGCVRSGMRPQRFHW